MNRDDVMSLKKDDFMLKSLSALVTTEKEELTVLNDRLGDLFVRLERARRGGDKHDNSSYMQAIAALQDEVNKQRTTYESEVTRLRREVDRVSGEKHEIQASVEKYKNRADLLQTKLDDSVNERQRLKDDLTQLSAYATQRETEVTSLSSQVHSLRTDLDLLRPRAEKFEQDANKFCQQMEAERRARLEAEARLQQTNEKLTFDAKLHQQHIRDLQERIDSSHAMLAELNGQLKEAMKGGDSSNPASVLAKVREAMVREIDAYKKEVEESMNRVIVEMRDKLETSGREKEALGAEKDRLESLLSALQGEINELRGQLTSAQLGNQQLQQTLQTYKASSGRNVRELEARLSDAQDSLVRKAQEVSVVREVQATLRTEIESYKAIVEAEEQKVTNMVLPPLATNTSTITTSSSAFHTRGYPVSCAQCASRNVATEKRGYPPVIGPIVGNRNLAWSSERPITTGARIARCPHTMTCDMKKCC